MAEQARVSKAGAYAELGDEAVLVSKAGAYVELGDEAVFVSKFGVYVEIDTGTVRVSKAGAYLEIAPPPATRNSLHIYYNDILLDRWVKGFSMESQVKTNDSSDMVVAGKQQPSLSLWLATLNGIWDTTLDAIFGGEVVGRGASSTMYNFRVVLGPWGNQVEYRWTAAAFVGMFKPKMNIDEAMIFDAAIALSGTPTRSVSS